MDPIAAQPATETRFGERVPIAINSNRYSYFFRRRRCFETWTAVTVYKLRAAVRVPALRLAVEDLVRSHDGLRLQAELTPRHYAEYIAPIGDDYALQVAICRDESLGEFDRFAREQMLAAQRVFRFPGPLFKVLSIEHRASGTCLVAFVAHHLVLDLHSFRLVARDLFRRYEQLCESDEFASSDASSFAQYMTAVQAHWGAKEVLEASYWRSLPWSDVQPLRTEHAIEEHANEERYTQVTSVDLSQSQTGRLLQAVASCKAWSLSTVLLAAVSRAYGRWTNHETLNLATVFHGRTAPLGGAHFGSTLGWVSETVPLLLPCHRPWKQLLDETHRQSVAADARGKGYNWLCFMSSNAALREEFSAYPSPQISINLKLSRERGSSFDAVAQPAREYAAPLPAAPDTARVFLLSGGILLEADRLRILWDASCKLYSVQRLNLLARLCAEEIGQAARALSP